RVLNQKPYLVQIMGAIALHEGDVAEMKTGEGKTLASTMPTYLNALGGKGVHVITVNDYLAQRDADWMGAIYKFLGLTVGVNHRELTPAQKKAAFACDITYTTNSEIGFDYLRDNMTVNPNDRVLRSLNMAIIDEADSILIDESRTPLIISGGQRQTANLYIVSDKLVKTLKKDVHYTIDVESKTVQLTDEGNSYAEKVLKIDNLYRIEYTSLVHHLHQALKANYIMQKDVDYVVQDGEVVIVDSFTGRLLKGRTYSDGLHQAIEAKEGVQIKSETSVLATITYQNFFRLYEKLGGMTGTAKTEEEEFLSTYNMRVVEIPTNKKIIREDAPDLVYAKKDYKYKALINEIKERHGKGQPLLVGTIAVETSELISDMLTKEGIKHEVLNAKNHLREAEIIAKAGEKGSVTIATNMAGRGTDIKLGEGVADLGGLAVLGSERHESRRIDNQLRGRAGRQGDPGFSRFYVSLEDDLMLRFGNDAMRNMFKSLGEEAIESNLVTRVITSAQTRVEGYNFDVRKNLLGYDDVLRQQREIMYKQRDDVIFTENAHPIVIDLFGKVAQDIVDKSIYYEAKEPLVDIAKVKKQLIPQFIREEALDLEVINGLSPNKTVEAIKDLLISFFERNKALWGEKVFLSVEKQILIRIIDLNWTQHIDRMSKLRDGIHLRAYAQTNPLQSYINEGYQMFQDMVLRIAYETCVYCLHAVVKFEKKPIPPENKDADKKD
ncbi:MAG: preprotein translocase subunit SecA, partial [Bacilli bacterium]|nr:preprotein translocase subunit SecA [Bacilli bacterium]